MLHVLYEDNHLIAVVKPAGISVQGGEGEGVSLLEETRAWIKQKYQKPGNVFVGLVHRLDKPVSGVILFAKTSKGASRLSEQFREGKVRKVYRALVEGAPKKTSGKLRHKLFRDEARRKTFVSEDGGQEAILSYEVLQQWPDQALVEVDLETGRKHQIRAQFSAEGLYVLGDRKYGSCQDWGQRGIALEAHRLEFFHPIRQEEKITVQLPEALCRVK